MNPESQTPEVAPQENATPVPLPQSFDELPLSRKIHVVVTTWHGDLSLPAKITLWLVLAGAALLPVAYLSKPAFQEWRRRNAWAAGVKAEEVGNLNLAFLSYKKGTLGSNDPARWKQFAAFAGKYGIPDASRLWDRATDLDPHDASAWLEAIDAHLEGGRIQHALNAFAKMPADVASTPSIRLSHASVLAIAKDTEGARRVFETIDESQIVREADKLKYCLLLKDVSAPDAESRFAKTIEELSESSDSHIRVTALNVGLNAALRENLRVTGIHFAGKLAVDESTPFSIRLSALQALMKLNAPSMDTAIVRVGEFAGVTPETRSSFVRFLVQHKQIRAAETWVKNLDASPQERSLLQADIDLQQGDLNQFLRRIDLSGLSDDSHTRLQMLVDIAGRWTGNPHKAFEEWLEQIKAIPRNDTGLDFALEIARQSNWDAAQTAVLQYSLELSPNRPDIILALIQHYKKSGNLRSAQPLEEKLADLVPNKIEFRNAAIHSKLLVTANVAEASRTQLEALMASNPNNPQLAATYALALYRLGEFQKAKDFLEHSSHGALASPQTQLYYGAVLAELGENRPARAALDRAGAGDTPLFEEQLQLLKTARLRIANGIAGNEQGNAADDQDHKAAVEEEIRRITEEKRLRPAPLQQGAAEPVPTGQDRE